MPELFSKTQIRMLGFEHRLSSAACSSRHRVLRKLTRRIEDGTLAGLAETRAEQSFNERLFAEVFDYRTLLRDGVGDYHLLPKGAVVVGRRTRYDDFSLGFFGSTAHQRVVHAELKNYPTLLDDIQTSGRHAGKSPVKQAFEVGVLSQDAEWILVSNFDELRLYHRTDSQRYERVVLSDIVSDKDLRHACVVFGRETLLGKVGTISPLLRILRGGHPVLLPEEPHQVRLIHEARPLIGGEASLPAMDDAFRSALDRAASVGWAWRVPCRVDPEYDDGRLVVVDDRPAKTPVRLEYARNGVVRLQEYLDTDDPSGAAPPVLVSPRRLADHMSMFFVAAARMIAPVFPGEHMSFRWSLLDAEKLVVTRSPRPGLRCDVDEVTSRELEHDAADPRPGTRASNAMVLSKALKDLLFPWAHRPSRGTIERLQWDDADSENVLTNLGA